MSSERFSLVRIDDIPFDVRIKRTRKKKKKKRNATFGSKSVFFFFFISSRSLAASTKTTSSNIHIRISARIRVSYTSYTSLFTSRRALYKCTKYICEYRLRVCSPSSNANESNRERECRSYEYMRAIGQLNRGKIQKKKNTQLGTTLSIAAKAAPTAKVIAHTQQLRQLSLWIDCGNYFSKKLNQSLICILHKKSSIERQLYRLSENFG